MAGASVQNTVPLTESEQEIADKAKTAAMQIVEDALEKKMYGHPVSFHYTCSEPPRDPKFYKFCCIPTEQHLKDLLKKMDEVNFLKDIGPDTTNTIAYVCVPDETCTIYLCPDFWTAPDDLREDSQPGTLIHEVSHFLGTEDICYDLLTVELFEDHGTLMGKRNLVEDLQGNYQIKEDVTLINANSLEHEFETVINHQEKYDEGKYLCCNETKRNSVCKSRLTDHYHLHERFECRKTEMAARKETLCNEKTRAIVRLAKIKGRACQRTVICAASE
nr:uncharacterized protein LOC111859417 [Paramormyrops kingsleyae]